MAYRPYPNAERALRQVQRRQPDAPVIPMPECLRPMAESFDQWQSITRRVMGAQFEVGAYRISTRR